MERRTKVYVKVNADHDIDGSCRPRSIILEDGRKFNIYRLKQVRRAASTKVGGTGLRYTVSILGKDTYLFDEENGKWFVELKQIG